MDPISRARNRTQLVPQLIAAPRIPAPPIVAAQNSVQQVQPSAKSLLANFAEPVLVGLAAAAFDLAINGGGHDMSIANWITVPSPIAMGLAAGVASLATETINNFVLNKAPSAQMLGMFLKPAITGVSTALLGYVALMPPDASMGDIAQYWALGAASELAGNFVYNRVAPMIAVH